ncbi:MAG: hypothetical protein QXT88_04780 [Desulfurococcaceae archaeon]|uniref:Uncharacterized protein n=1 Tax=Staphylothermus marinus TaxID=2280 RepID=A0A7C4NQB7_STAMA
MSDRFSKTRPSQQPYKDSSSRFEKGFEKRQFPTPIGDNCSPSCPLFKCTNNSLVMVNKTYRGKVVKEPYCRMTGSKCIGYECRFAGCRINALLPNGKCAKAVEKKVRVVSEEELYREISQVEEYDLEDFM